MKRITIIGSTGSIGRQTLEIVRKNPDKFKVCGLIAHSDYDLMARQIREFKVEFAALTNAYSSSKLKELVSDCKILNPDSALTDCVKSDLDVLVVACSGINGLLPTLKALELGIDVALANKETLVVGGELVRKAISQGRGRLLPVDSEHSAIWQSIGVHKAEDISRILITASGGAFRDLTIEQLENVKAKDALKHPNWNMGKKITIDCATLMNKGLEIIEGAFLFDISSEKIIPIIQPESIIHSMVEYNDGAIIAQLGSPSMLVPISYALSYPERWETDVKKVDFVELGKINFSEPDRNRFPCLKIAEETAKSGAIMRTVMNAANDIAVEMFLKERIGFMQIPRIIQDQLESYSENFKNSLDDILECDAYIRAKTLKSIRE